MLGEEDISGGEILQFPQRIKRDAMALVASSAKSTPRKSVIGSHVLNDKENQQKVPGTPMNLRRRIKKCISDILDEDAGMASEGNDFSSDESDDWSAGEEEEEEIQSTPSGNHSGTIFKTPMSRGRTRSQTTQEYIPASEDFFRGINSGKKSDTSEHTLDLLKSSRLPIHKIFSLLSQLKTSAEHEKTISQNIKDYQSFFVKWLYVMNEGFNLILYGLGSKRQLLQTFQMKFLNEQPVVVVNGFFPSLAIKHVLNHICQDILEHTSNPDNSNDQVDFIQKEFELIPSTHLFLIVHNIDGLMLQNSNAQEILSRLAKIRNIHLIATIDHINAPLLWDSTKLNNFNFSWWDCTTLVPYSDETAFEDSLLVQQSCGFALSSLRSVFSSLTTNARGVLLLIVDNQLKNRKNSNYQGMPLKDLYWNCREKFLVSSETALRAQLTEFTDHKLIKTKRSVDGIELLTIPIEHSLLEQFMEEQNK